MMQRKTGLLTGMLLAAFLCTGCSMKQSHENTDLGMAAVQTLDYETALGHFEKAALNGEELEAVYRGEGIAYMGLSRYGEAAASFEKALSYSRILITELDYDVNYYLAAAYYKDGDLKKAIGVYDAILALRPKETAAYYMRGIVKLDQNDLKGAMADFDEALSLQPEDYAMLVNVHCALADNGYKENGTAYLQAALERGESTMSGYDRGRIAYYMEDYERARNLLEQVRDNKNADTILLLGRTYEALGDYNYAASVYTNYLAQDEVQPEIYNQLGLCKMKVGDYEAALTAFQSGLAIENNAFGQKLQFNEIVAYEYLGDFKKAAVLMETYCKLYPDDTGAQREYEFLKTR